MNETSIESLDKYIRSHRKCWCTGMCYKQSLHVYKKVSHISRAIYQLVIGKRQKLKKTKPFHIS